MIAKFKKGGCNTLVATCVAEEGLDIGDVNLIISYDCLSSPIRMVQRFGRTGRAGVGTVIILIQKGEEETKWRQSQKNSKAIMSMLKTQSKQQEPQKGQQSNLNFGQKQLVQEQQINYYSFNPRMLPDDVQSEPVYRKLEMRTEAELEKIKLMKAKLLKLKKSATRKSVSLNPSKVRRESIIPENEI